MTEEKQMDSIPFGYECRLCGAKGTKDLKTSPKFIKVFETDSLVCFGRRLSSAELKYCECCTCTTIFSDPKKFFRKIEGGCEA